MTRVNFNDPDLVAEYGSWIRVQVAFYDFVFEEANRMCAGHITEEMLRLWKDGESVYEKFIKAIEVRFKTSDEAWREFLIERETEEESQEGA